MKAMINAGKIKYNATIALAVLSMSSCPGQTLGETVGLYRFDTIADSNDGIGGEYFFDSSGNELSLVNQWNNWSQSPWISASTPTVAPAGSFSLGTQALPALSAAVTDKYSIGNTGQLSVEFWYKPQSFDGYHYILGQSNQNNGWLIYQTPPVAGKSAIEFYATNNSGNVVKVATPNLFDGTTDWSHVAVTIDASGTGRFYLNGNQVASAGGLSGFSPYSAGLTVGSQPGTGGFTNNFLMDDLRISSEALAPGQGTGVNQLAWNASLSQGVTEKPRAADFGKQWLRQRPFMISSWLSTADENDLPLYQEANMTASLGGWYQSHPNYGIEQHYLGGYITLDDAARKQMHIANNLPALGGWLLADEILPEQIPGLAGVASHIRAINSDAILYAGMGSSNPEYISSVVQAVKPDALIHGYYSFTGATRTDVEGHFADFEYFRRGAMQNNLPFFAFIQAFADGGTIENRRLPSESELRFEVFSKLAGGAQGIAYFVFDPRNGGPATNGVLTREGEPSPLYEPFKQANAEVQNLGRSLRYIQTTEWRYVAGLTGSAPNPVPRYMMAFTTDPAIDPHLMSAGVNTSNPANRGVHKDGVIGFFVDDNRQHYFMLSNVFQGVGKSAAETSLEFFLQFDSSVNSILRLNRLTGEPERIDLENNRLVFTLPGGTGDLFKYGDGIFAGISIGDATLDDQVDYSDMQTFAANYGIQQNARWSMGDFNLDGRVDFEDLSLLAANYNAGEVQAHADFNALIPEPSTIGGFCLSAVLISRPRSSRHAK